MPHRFHIVDVFAEERYAGNPLAVVRDAADLDTRTLQRIAKEFGFSETTFVVGDAGSGDGVRVRIFTPDVELPFAGHPTLGSAWVIRHHLLAASPDGVVLALGVGRVPVRFERASGLAWLTAPPIRLGKTLEAARIAPALGLGVEDVARDLPAQHLDAGVQFVHVPLASPEAVSRARLDPAAFAPLAEEGFPTAVYWFARGGDHDLRARMQFFASDDAARAVREDPATGSATACLGAYLLAHRGAELTLSIAQGVEMGRPSLLHLEARGDATAPRIRVGGRVVEVAAGELL